METVDVGQFQLSQLPPRIAAKIQVDLFSGCWVWQGATDKYGYGQVRHEGKMRRTHRAVWSIFNGPIPQGIVLDHLLADRAQAPGPCVHGPSCCNPAHLEPVTIAVNGSRVRNWHAAKTHCPQGHRYEDLWDEATDLLLEQGHSRLYVCKDGGIRRFCMACRRERDAVRRVKVVA